MIHVGDCLDVLRTLDDASVQTCVTSPPYFGLRDYGHDGQIGLEQTPGEYVARLVEVFREVHRVLRDDGTVWLNLGDSYAGSWGAQGKRETPGELSRNSIRNHPKRAQNTGSIRQEGLKPKDLMLLPARVAIALQDDGWYVRQDIIWRKPNPMPESVTDRCTKSHEYIFLLSKSPRYYFDQAAIAEPVASDPEAARNRWNRESPTPPGQKPQKRVSRSGNTRRKTGSDRGCPAGTGANVCGSVPWAGTTRNKRSVWSVATRPFAGAHFAVFPPDLIRPCVLAGAPEGGVVLDPFAGAGTTGVVCAEERREFVGIELNPEYAALAGERIAEAEAIAACSWDQLPLLAGLS